MQISYSSEFYKTYEDESAGSAVVVVPLAMEFVKPRRVLDVGCGIGTWLSAFAANGVEEIHGIDGDYVNRSLLKIAPDRFTACDLKEGLNIIKNFYDLVISLEVAEHLQDSCAASFITNLTKLAPVIMFSAAIPFQGGDNHVNEQWPGYWAELFARHGFVPIDCIRPRIWENEKVAYYYAQNIIMYVNSDHLKEYPLLQQEHGKNSDPPRALVHPRKWLEAHDPLRQPLRPLMRALPNSLLNAIALRLRRLVGKNELLIHRI